MRILFSKGIFFLFLLFYTIPIFLYDKVNQSITLYISAIIISTLFFFIFFKIKESEQTEYKSLGSKTSILLVIIFFVLNLFIYLKTRHEFTGLFIRSTRDSEFLQGNLFVVISILIKSVFIVLLLRPHDKRYIVPLLLVFTIFFDFAYLGARRTSIFMVLAFFWMLLAKLSRAKILIYSIIIAVFGILSFLFSGYREILYSGFETASIQQIVDAAVFTNEFQIVSLNILEYIEYAENFGYDSFRFLISPIVVLIPRFIWYTKPMTIDKITGIFPNIIGELYLAFGIFSLVLFILFAWALINLVSKNRFYSVVIFSSIPDFFRTTVDQFILTQIIFLIFLTLFFKKIKW